MQGDHAGPGEKQDLLLVDSPQSYKLRLEYVKRLVDKNSGLIAQIIKSWVKKDG